MAPLLVTEITSIGLINGTDSANCDAVVCINAGGILETGSIGFRAASGMLVEGGLIVIKGSSLSLPRVGCELLYVQNVC